MTSKEARELIGQQVLYGRKGSSFPLGLGVIQDVCRKNIMIDMNWYWLPDIDIEEPTEHQ